MLYPRNTEAKLDPELFRRPTAEYRGAPFWAWNCDLKDDLLRREIEVMRDMGMGGFHMHTRSGMSIKYLSDEFMDKVRLCVEEARKNHMLAWLYDEDKWPSGFAGGYVTEKEENRQRFLLFSPKAPEKGALLARYEVSLRSDGRLDHYRRLGAEEKSGRHCLVRVGAGDRAPALVPLQRVCGHHEQSGHPGLHPYHPRPVSRGAGG